jgi:hypothetical protein
MTMRTDDRLPERRRAVTAGSWLDITEGRELRCLMRGSNEAYLTIGGSGVEHELTFDFVSLAELVRQASRVQAEMEARADQEEAAWRAERLAAEQAAHVQRPRWPATKGGAETTTGVEGGRPGLSPA